MRKSILVVALLFVIAGCVNRSYGQTASSTVTVRHYQSSNRVLSHFVTAKNAQLFIYRYLPSPERSLTDIVWVVIWDFNGTPLRVEHSIHGFGDIRVFSEWRDAILSRDGHMNLTTEEAFLHPDDYRKYFAEKSYEVWPHASARRDIWSQFRGSLSEVVRADPYLVRFFPDWMDHVITHGVYFGKDSYGGKTEYELNTGSGYRLKVYAHAATPQKVSIEMHEKQSLYMRTLVLGVEGSQVNVTNSKWFKPEEDTSRSKFEDFFDRDLNLNYTWVPTEERRRFWEPITPHLDAFLRYAPELRRFFPQSIVEQLKTP